MGVPQDREVDMPGRTKGPKEEDRQRVLNDREAARRAVELCKQYEEGKLKARELMLELRDVLAIHITQDR